MKTEPRRYQQVSVRFDTIEIKRIDALIRPMRARLEKLLPGAQINRTVVVRSAIERGLEQLEKELQETK